MKKVLSYCMILVGFLVLGSAKSVYAVEFSSDNIPNSTYVIGKCMFTRETSESYSGTLTTDVIMLAAKTIESNDLADMLILYKNARGSWVNALTNQPVEVGENFNIEYKNNEVYLEKPLLENVTLKNFETGSEQPYIPELVNGGYHYDLGIANLSSSVTGYEIYAIDGDTYESVGEGLLHNPETFEVVVAPGERKVYVAKTYAKRADDTKIYSEYSNEIVIDHSSYAVPELKNEVINQWNLAHPNEPYIAELSNGHYEYDLGINSSAYVRQVTQSSYVSNVSGYEISTKDGDTYTFFADATIGSPVIVAVQPGEAKTFVARVFATKENGDKVYSGYSNEVVIDHTVYTIPELRNDTVYQWSLAHPDDPYVPTLVEGHYEYDLGINTGDYIRQVTESVSVSNISGYEIAIKDGDTYTFVANAMVGSPVVVTVQPGESVTYVARVFATKENGDKVYSGYSEVVTIDHSN